MRIKISKRNSELIDKLTDLYDFKGDSIIACIAFSYSLQLNKRFILEEDLMPSDGKEWRDEKSLFGASADEKLYKIYKALMDQHYGKDLQQDEFVKLFKKHLDFGLEKISSDIFDQSVVKGYHIAYLMKIVKNGLDLITSPNPFIKEETRVPDTAAYNGLITLNFGKDESNNDVSFRINDISEFDSCNIAIAGMTGSGKTELAKDLLYQVAVQSDKQVKFIYFDYKGNGPSDRLKSFFDATDCKMVDLNTGPIDLNPLAYINVSDEHARGGSFEILRRVYWFRDRSTGARPEIYTSICGQ